MAQMTLEPIADTYISCVTTEDRNTNFGSAHSMYVGALDHCRSLVNFDLTKIPSKVGILKAVLRVHLYGVADAPRPTIGTYRITSYWEEMKVTWNTRPTFDPTVTDTKTPTSLCEWAEFDVTSIIKHQYEIPLDRFGILLKDIATAYGRSDFDTKEEPYWNNPPKLVVNYSTPEETIREFWHKTFEAITENPAMSLGLIIAFVVIIVVLVIVVVT